MSHSNELLLLINYSRFKSSMASRMQDSVDLERMNEQEIANFIQNLLKQMQDKFEDMTKNVGERVEKMSTKIDDIEKSINDLLKEVNTDNLDN